MKFWFEDEKRLKVAKKIQKLKIEFLKKIWGKDKELQEEGFNSDNPDISSALEILSKKIDKATNVTNLLLSEAQLTNTIKNKLNKIEILFPLYLETVI